MTLQRGDTPAFRAAMTDPNRSGWFRYWLMLAWERRPRADALKDAQSLQNALDPTTPMFTVSGLLRSERTSYWLRHAFQSAIRHASPAAHEESRILAELLRERVASSHPTFPDDNDQVAA